VINSSCIYGVENQMGTLLSSSCQLRLGGWSSCLRLSHYTPKVLSALKGTSRESSGINLV